MNEQETEVTEQITENSEQTQPVTADVEQTQAPAPKTYTQEEVDALVGKRLARQDAKIRKEFERKYGDLTEVLKAGTQKENVGEITDDFRKFYASKGIKIPEKPAYSDRDISVLARADADEIISAGYEEVVEEVDRLVKLGAANMSPREKAMFPALAEYRRKAEQGRELSQLGVAEDVYGSKGFQDFAAKFSATTPIREIYEIYQRAQPQKQYQTMGSMKNNAPADNGVKEFYSPDEARKFTKQDFDKNPALFDAVVNSMQKWK